MRPSDKPGDYRVREQPDGQWRVSGMKLDGTRVKHQRFTNKSEAEMYVALNFPTETKLDEWGLPISQPSDMRMNPETIQKVNAAAGINPALTGPTEAEKKKAKGDAMALSELIGTGWAAGTVWTGRKLSERIGNEPVNPSPKTVDKLADSAAKTIQSWFGEREIKPWQLTCLLTFGILIIMLVQSKPKKAAETKPDLKSVP